MISKRIKKMWEDEGWKYSEKEEGFNFAIEFPFDKFTRRITVYFETKPRKYYYIDVKLYTPDRDAYAQENLFIEMKEHEMIHKTLKNLKWIEVNKNE